MKYKLRPFWCGATKTRLDGTTHAAFDRDTVCDFTRDVAFRRWSIGRRRASGSDVADSASERARIDRAPICCCQWIQQHVPREHVLSRVSERSPHLLVWTFIWLTRESSQCWQAQTASGSACQFAEAWTRVTPCPRSCLRWVFQYTAFSKDCAKDARLHGGHENSKCPRPCSAFWTTLRWRSSPNLLPKADGWSSQSSTQSGSKQVAESLESLSVLESARWCAKIGGLRRPVTTGKCSAVRKFDQEESGLDEKLGDRSTPIGTRVSCLRSSARTLTQWLAWYTCWSPWFRWHNRMLLLLRHWAAATAAHFLRLEPPE